MMPPRERRVPPMPRVSCLKLEASAVNAAAAACCQAKTAKCCLQKKSSTKRVQFTDDYYYCSYDSDEIITDS